MGTVLAPGSQRASECRMAAFYAGFPGMCRYSVLVNLICDSDLLLIIHVILFPSRNCTC